MSMSRSSFLCLVLAGSLALSGSAWAGEGWGSVLRPAPGPARVLGSYAQGCIAGAEALPPEGEGFRVLRLKRNRFYGHPALIGFITAFGHQAAAEGLSVLVGDMAQPRGGPMSYGHSSHQTGLDVDIWFRLSPPDDRENPEPVSMVRADGRDVDASAFTARHARLVEIAARADGVERIFVNPAIKKALCRASGDAAWLGKVRPWWGHDSHFHVRLSCPADDSECKPQSAPPPGTGCDEVESWIDAAVRPRRTTVAPKPRPAAPQALPAACQQVLTAK